MPDKSADNKSKVTSGEDLQSLKEKTGNFFHDLTNLKDGLDRRGMIKRIKENIKMRGANAWLLMCSIMIASLGLDLNSPAVIIGAMLISPLMAPILGVGLGIGISDRETTYLSLRHFGIAIAIALVTSTLYFTFTPLGGETAEITSRTRPGFLDAMIALFGGIAGVISSSRKDVSNAIPGVAIATALMPPLCVTGFGIANLITGTESIKLDFWIVMWNSFFLFFLNATLVALATYIIVKIVRLPRVDFANEKEERRTRLALFSIAAFMIFVSIIIFLRVKDDVDQELSVKNFVKENFSNAYYESYLNPNNDSLFVKLFLFDDLTKEEKENYNKSLVLDYEADRTYIEYIYNDNSQLENTQDIQGAQLQDLQIFKEKANQKIANIEYQLDSLNNNLNKIKLENSIENELQIVFPELNDVDLDLNDGDNPATIILNWKRNNQLKEKENRLYDFICRRAQIDTLEISRRVR